MTKKTARFSLLFFLAILISLIKTAMPRWWESPQAVAIPEDAPISRDWEVVAASDHLPDFAAMTPSQIDRYLDSLLSAEARQAIRDLDRTIAAAR